MAKFSGVNGSNIWSRAFPYSQFTMGATVAVDAAGRVLVTGSFIGTGDFGAGPVTSAGAGDVFVAEYSGVDGSHLWSRHFASSVGEYGLGEGVAADASGNVVVTGALAGTMDFGGGPLTSDQSEEIFLLKLSGVNGSHLWSKHFAHAYGQFPPNPIVAVDTNGNVYLTGGCFDGADFGGGPLPGISNVASMFVAKFSGVDGAHLWSKGFGRVPGCSGTTCSGQKWGAGIAVDTSGNVVVTADSMGTVDLGGGSLTGLGPYGECMLVAKFTGADGSHLWSKCFSSSDGGASAVGTAVDASGNVLVTGAFSRTMDFGGGPLTSAVPLDEPYYYPPDIFLLKLHF